MSAPLRLLLSRGPDPADAWRAAFDLAQAAAALDVALELGFAGDGLRLIERACADPRAARTWASLELLGVEGVRVRAGSAGLPGDPALPLQVLDDQGWRAWLRAGPLQVW